MGFQNTATTITLTAKLTPIGREKLVTQNINSLITKFGVGDSDANYNTSARLSSGNIPSVSGNLAGNGSSTSVFNGVTIKSFLNVNPILDIYKTIEPNSTELSYSTQHIGVINITGDSMTQIVTDRTNSTDKYLNLFHSFGLPLSSDDVNNYTGTTYGNGGFSDTALSGLGSDNILIVGIPNVNYGELVDGKTVKLYIETLSGTSAYTIYSTFENTQQTTKTLDSELFESSLVASQFGTNYVFLFSDDVQKPNNDSTKSWGTGYGTAKPFNTYNKERYNLQTDANNSLLADKAVGIAFLDKGFIIITHPDIVNNFDYTGGTTMSATSLTINSVSTEVSQQVTCLLGRNEFASSRNITYGTDDTVRISEIGLYDDNNNLIAIAKTDRHLTKQTTEFLSVGIKITI